MTALVDYSATDMLPLFAAFDIPHLAFVNTVGFGNDSMISVINQYSQYLHLRELGTAVAHTSAICSMDHSICMVLFCCFP
jgi:hypothetical protein